VSLRIDDVQVVFGGVTALAGATFAVEPGAIVAVVGPNGSGKSTLFNAISGFAALRHGRIELDGQDIVGLPPSSRIALGLARTFQTPRFDPEETVENAVRCGFYPTASVGMAATMLRLPRSAREELRIEDESLSILARFKLHMLRHRPVGQLPMGHVRLVEVARAIANRPKYLLLDEPAAGLTKPEQQTLITEIRALSMDGIGVLLVEHNFDLVRQLADDVIVLNRGSCLMKGEPGTIARDPLFIKTYLGQSGMTAGEA
jgi:branched-chain amino acid transport system ATP-binding protein